MGGAHYQTITEIIEDGVIISAQMNSPTTLNSVELKDLLDEVVTLALSENAELKDNLNKMSGYIQIMEDNIKALNLELEELAKKEVSVEVPAE